MYALVTLAVVCFVLGPVPAGSDPVVWAVHVAARLTLVAFCVWTAAESAPW
jgi:hypothetical protein